MNRTEETKKEIINLLDNKYHIIEKGTNIKLYSEKIVRDLVSLKSKQVEQSLIQRNQEIERVMDEEYTKWDNDAEMTVNEMLMNIISKWGLGKK